ncbi:MAG: nucleotidyltransferase family protein [Thermoplasmata archaeon]
MCPRCKSKLWDTPKITPLAQGNQLGIEEILKPHLKEIRRLARRHGASRIMVFGSVRRGQATERSDIDLLVKWKRPVSLLVRAGLCADLEKLLGRTVDLANEGGLHWAIAPQVVAEAVPL